MEDCCEEARRPTLFLSKNGKLILFFFKYFQAYEAQHILRNGTYELPRMTRVLDNHRVCT
jgi:hypothetical protein